MTNSTQKREAVKQAVADLLSVIVEEEIPSWELENITNTIVGYASRLTDKGFHQLYPSIYDGRYQWLVESGLPFFDEGYCRYAQPCVVNLRESQVQVKVVEDAFGGKWDGTLVVNMGGEVTLSWIIREWHLVYRINLGDAVSIGYVEPADLLESMEIMHSDGGEKAIEFLESVATQ